MPVTLQARKDAARDQGDESDTQTVVLRMLETAPLWATCFVRTDLFPASEESLLAVLNSWIRSNSMRRFVVLNDRTTSGELVPTTIIDCVNVHYSLSSTSSRTDLPTSTTHLFRCHFIL